MRHAEPLYKPVKGVSSLRAASSARLAQMGGNQASFSPAANAGPGLQERVGLLTRTYIVAGKQGKTGQGPWAVSSTTRAVLRACPGTSGAGQPAGHGYDHREVDHGVPRLPSAEIRAVPNPAAHIGRRNRARVDRAFQS